MSKIFDSLQPYVLLLARFLLAAIFIKYGWDKIESYAPTASYMASMGLSGMLLPLVILLELGAGLGVLLGLFTRLSSLSIALFCIASALMFHYYPDNSDQMIHFMKNISMAGGFLVLMVTGPGKFSLDAKLNKSW